MLSVGGMRSFFNRFGNSCAILMLLAFAVPLVISFSNNQLGSRVAHTADANRTAETEIATINGQAVTEADFREIASRVQQRRGSAAPGQAYAKQQGEAMDGLIQRTVIRQEVQKRNLRPLEADIDKEIDQFRQAIATRQNKPKLTDQEWESFLSTNMGLSSSELRERTAKDLQPLALLNDLKSQEKVTEVEARNQSAQVRLTMVVIPFQEAGARPAPNAKTKPLTEAEAQQKANDLYAKVKAGADIAAIAKANDTTGIGGSKTSDSGVLPEYTHQVPGQFSLSLAALYGKDFAEAVHKLEKGQMSEVFKLNALQKGYGFGKLVERTLNTPKEFDPKKAIAALIEERAGEKADKLVKALMKSAKVEFKDPDKKAYYDLFKLDAAGQESFQTILSGGTPEPQPSKAETDAQQAVVNKEFEDMLKRHADDVNAAMLVADDIRQHKMMEPGAQDRLIQLDETILKANEDQERRFDLASLYREKKQYDKAKVQYDRVAKLLGYNKPYDMDTMKAASDVHHKLELGYRSVNQSVEADREKIAFDELQEKMKLESLKQLEEQRKAKKGAGVVPSGSGISLPPGGSATMPTDLNTPQPPITITPSPSGGKGPAPLPIEGIDTGAGASAPPAPGGGAMPGAAGKTGAPAPLPAAPKR